MYKGLFLSRVKKKKEIASRGEIKKKLRLLDSFSFLLGFRSVLIVYVMSTFLQEVSGLNRIEIFYIFGYTASFLILINFHFLIKKIGKSKAFLLVLGIKAVALLGIAAFPRELSSLFFAVVILSVGPIVWVGLDILVESFSSDKITGSIRGKLLTTMNIGCLLAPLLSTYIISRTGSFRWSFLLAGIIVLIVFFLTFIKFPKVNHNIKKVYPIKKIIKKIIKRKNVSRIYYISFLMEIFYAVMIVYTPIYLLGKGLVWSQIGLIFTVMLVPFVLIQYPIGYLADKKTGEKELLALAIIITGISTSLIAFIETSNLFPWMLVLFTTRIGIAMIEVLRDSYFYKRISPCDVDIIDFYRTTRSLSYIVAMIFFGLLLIILPVKFIFIFLSLLIFTGLIALWNLEDNKVF